MRFSDIAHTCAQNLLRRKSRTILTVLGVIVGCCSIVLMISIGQGISEQNEQMLKSMGNLNDITVTAAGGSGAYDSLWRRYVEFVFVGHDIIGSAGPSLTMLRYRRSVAFQASRP